MQREKELMVDVFVQSKNGVWQRRKVKKTTYELLKQEGRATGKASVAIERGYKPKIENKNLIKAFVQKKNGVWQRYNLSQKRFLERKEKGTATISRYEAERASEKPIHVKEEKPSKFHDSKSDEWAEILYIITPDTPSGLAQKRSIEIHMHYWVKNKDRLGALSDNYVDQVIRPRIDHFRKTDIGEMEHMFDGANVGAEFVGTRSSFSKPTFEYFDYDKGAYGGKGRPKGSKKDKMIGQGTLNRFGF